MEPRKSGKLGSEEDSKEVYRMERELPSTHEEDLQEVQCSALTYRCANGHCVSKSNPECDEEEDCEDGSDEKDCECGIKPDMPKRSRRVVGGQVSMDGEWPWQVSLHFNGSHRCGASVISDQWLLTAAHCVNDKPGKPKSKANLWKAFLGLHAQGSTTPKTVKRKIKRIICHEGYNNETMDNDIALMKLGGAKLVLNQSVYPICLPSATHDFPVGTAAWITGWGKSSWKGSKVTLLQKGEVRIINQTVCKNERENNKHKKVTENMMCAAGVGKVVDSCQGDSGGPLSVPESKGTKVRYFLAGVNSWGKHCGKEKNKPGVKVRVTKYRDWIKRNTGV